MNLTLSNEKNDKLMNIGDMDQNVSSIKCDEILLMMFIPAIDSLRVTIERIIKGNSPLKPDMRHLHHLLIKQFNKNTVFIPYTILSSLTFLLSIFFNTFIILILSLIFYFIIFYFFNTK